MTEEEEVLGYVVFVELKTQNGVRRFFVHEYNTCEEAERLKALINQKVTLMSASVGLVVWGDTPDLALVRPRFENHTFDFYSMSILDSCHECQEFDLKELELNHETKSW